MKNKFKKITEAHNLMKEQAAKLKKNLSKIYVVRDGNYSDFETLLSTGDITTTKHTLRYEKNHNPEEYINKVSLNAPRIYFEISPERMEETNDKIVKPFTKHLKNEIARLEDVTLRVGHRKWFPGKPNKNGCYSEVKEKSYLIKTASGLLDLDKAIEVYSKGNIMFDVVNQVVEEYFEKDINSSKKWREHREHRYSRYY